MSLVSLEESEAETSVLHSQSDSDGDDDYSAYAREWEEALQVTRSAHNVKASAQQQ